MQPPFVGPSYDLESRPASVQRTINLVPVMLEPGNERAGWAFEDVPGFLVFGVAAVGPEIILVSNPYPVMFEDAADVTHAFVSGGLYSWPLENVDVTHAPIGGTLTDVLLTYAIQVENVDVTHDCTGGILTEVDLMRYYNVPVENVDVTHALVSGVLADVLLTYSNWPVENVDVTHAMTGGTLT